MTGRDLRKSPAVVIAVVGGKKSGKTTAVEALIKALASRAYRVAAVKHISEPHFTIDTEGKDTWRYARSGASTVVAVSAGEIATIERRGEDELQLDGILKRCRSSDVVVLEGFRRLVSKRKGVYKIVAVKSAQEALEAVRYFKPILAFTGRFSTAQLGLGRPYVDVLEEAEKLVDLVEAAMG